MADLKESILKYALQNAVKFDGKANPGAVIGKVLAEDPSMRERVDEIKKQVTKTIKAISKLSVEEQRKQLSALSPELLEKKKYDKHGLPDLPNAVMGKVITRIPPEPSKYNHIGHALSFLLNYLYAHKYSGKCILRFEDTNPNAEKQEYVDAMKEDCLVYLGIKPDEIIFASDEMPKLYKMSADLISQEKAYVCLCDRDAMQDNRHKANACRCRNASVKENLALWQKMLDGEYEEGQAVLRLKIDMEALNQVMRDPVIMRICKEPHYRQGDQYAVWPMYDFENAIMDCESAITHILRSIEFGTMRVELQDYIKDLFNYPHQTIIQYGRFNITGAITQGREIRKLIEEKKVLGWDDPRLVTLKALKRRGIVKETFYELATKVGLSKSETNLDFSLLASINRKLLDPVSDRFFFVENPVKVTIEGAPAQQLKLKLHPDFPDKGFREFSTTDSFYITHEDNKALKDGKLYRLMDCLNFTKQGKKLIFDSIEHEKYKDHGEAIIHWVPSESVIEVEVLTPDTTIIKGFGEKNMQRLNVGDVVQLQRFGFCRLDQKVGGNLVFWYTHK